MNLDLTAVRAKLSRCQEHAQTIRNEVLSWHERHPYSITTEVNADSTRYSIILRIHEPPSLQRWTLVFADALNNLRTSLDYLIYAIAVAGSRKNPPPYDSRLRFPIADCKDAFDEEVRTKRLGDISDPVRTVIESFQPYKRPHPDLPPLLAVLRDLNNIDKHRMLRLAFSSVAKGNIGFKGDAQIGGNWQCVTPSGEITDGAEIFAFVCDRPAPGMEYDRHIFDMIIAVWHKKRDPAGPEWTEHSEVSALLVALTKEVRTVIAAFLKNP